MPGKYFDQIRKVSGKVEKYLSDSIRNRFRDRPKDPKTILLVIWTVPPSVFARSRILTVPYHRKYFLALLLSDPV